MTSATRIDRVNILLVDDQPSKLLTYESILDELGENLIKASSASEALQCLLDNEIAVVLVDVCMPDLDGYELAAMIRQHPRFQKTSIIFVSAILMTDLDRIRGYECGAVDYVPVPVVPEILRAKVSVFADLYRKTRALERLNAELEQRVSERTAALEATTLSLQEADRRKDEFLAMVAHELRNPLAPIRTAAQLLKVKELAEVHQVRARDIIERQVEGSFVYGLSAALFGECTVKDGRMVEENFDTYPVVRMEDMPAVETIIVPSGGFWGGVGEPTIAVAAPAVLNAIFAATGKRVRNLPLKNTDLRKA